MNISTEGFILCTCRYMYVQLSLSCCHDALENGVPDYRGMHSIVHRTF